jgi:hypothetical protein
MGSGATAKDLIRRVVAALDRAAVPYMVTGSFASSLHGEPRSTHDIDIVIDPDLGSIERLILQFPGEKYYVSRQILRLKRGEIDLDYVEGWVDKLGVAVQWELAKDQAQFSQ